MKSKNKIILEEYDYESYLTTPEQYMDMLEEYGVAIIPGILTEEECTLFENGVWNYLENLKRDISINRNKCDTWLNIPKEKVAHESFIWNVRENPGILQIFASYWHCSPEELLVSYEAASITFPPEIIKKGWGKSPVFRRETKKEKIIRAFVTAKDINRGDATLTFIEGSHKTNHEDLEKETIHRRIRCLSGDLILWDTSMLYCQTGPIQARKHANFQMGIHLCYYPRTNVKSVLLKRKKKNFMEGRITTYHPIDYHYIEKKREEFSTSVFTDPLILGPIGKLLAGFYTFSHFKRPF